MCAEFVVEVPEYAIIAGAGIELVEWNGECGGLIFVLGRMVAV